MENNNYDRKKYSDAIVLSKSKKKLIVAGPGTGKTFTFKQVMDSVSGNKIILTFIRKLVSEMKLNFNDSVEVKTFHELCKGLLHKQLGSFDIQPYLSEIVESDANILGLKLTNFDEKFQNLDENTDEISFYLARSDYYKALSFNDSVYRFYKIALENNNVLPNYDQIIIDEYQDFNKLEVSLIEILKEKGPILIAGDDDQAVYDTRSSSPTHIRALYASGDYEFFELPFCSRCPKVVVDLVNEIILSAIKKGFFRDRVPKKYECYLPGKKDDSEKYPLATSVRLANIAAISKYIHKEISLIDTQDIQDSYKDEGYPTSLIIGEKHLLKKIEPVLAKDFNIVHNLDNNSDYSIINAFQLLLKDDHSNLGWRLIADLFSIDLDILKVAVKKSTESDVKFHDFIPIDLSNNIKKCVELVRLISSKDTTKQEYLDELKQRIPLYSDGLIDFFKPKENPELIKIDETKPSVLLTTYVGSKGLSGGHVFILGMNNGCLPKNEKNIIDVEISKLIVALTRTRKKAYLVSNKWFLSPKNKYGGFDRAFDKSTFLSWISQKYLDDKGDLIAKDI